MKQLASFLWQAQWRWWKVFCPKLDNIQECLVKLSTFPPNYQLPSLKRWCLYYVQQQRHNCTYTFYVQNWSMRLLSGMAIFLSEMPWPLNVSRQLLPAPSFVRPSVHLRRTCLNNQAGRHYAGAEKSPAWPSFINFYSLVLPRLTLASSPLHRRSAVAPCGNHTNLSCPKHIPVNTSTHFSTGHH